MSEAMTDERREELRHRYGNWDRRSNWPLHRTAEEFLEIMDEVDRLRIVERNLRDGDAIVMAGWDKCKADRRKLKERVEELEAEVESLRPKGVTVDISATKKGGNDE